VVLDHLVFHDPASGLFYCLLCKRNTHLVCCHCCLVEDLVYLLLRVCSKYLLSLPHRLHLGFEGLYAVNDFWYYFLLLSHLDYPPCEYVFLNMYSLLQVIVYEIVNYLSIGN